MKIKQLEQLMVKLGGYPVTPIGDILLVNLCPHPIYEINSGITIAECTKPLRVIANTSLAMALDGYNSTLPIYKTSVSIDENALPEEIQGVYYIISNLAANAIPSYRKDFLVPGPVVRDDKGRILGCNGLRKV